MYKAHVQPSRCCKQGSTILSVDELPDLTTLSPAKRTSQHASFDHAVAPHTASAAASAAQALVAAKEAAALKMPMWQHGAVAVVTVAAVVGSTVLVSKFLHAQADKALANQVLIFPPHFPLQTPAHNAGSCTQTCQGPPGTSRRFFSS